LENYYYWSDWKGGLLVARKIRKDITGPGLEKRLAGKTSARKIRKDAKGPGLAKRLSKGT
jgi:hypothetical protein